VSFSEHQQHPADHQHPAADCLGDQYIEAVEENVDDLQNPVDEPQLEQIELVEIPPQTEVSLGLVRAILLVNMFIAVLNAAIRGDVKLDPRILARSLRDLIRLYGGVTDNQRAISIFTSRLLSCIQKIGFSRFELIHPNNLATLISVGIEHAIAARILSTLSRISSVRDQALWFWLFVNLRLQTSIFEDQYGLNWFFAMVRNQNPQTPSNITQIDLERMMSEWRGQFNAVFPEGIQERADRKKARKDAGKDDASQAGSEFTAATIATGSPLGKHFNAAKNLSRLLREIFTGNELLRDLSDAQLVAIIYRFFTKTKCSKSKNFGDARAYSVEIYQKLMNIMWSETNSGRKFIPRKWDTFSAVFCATGSYAAAIAWLAQFVACEYNPKGPRSPHEIAVLQFMFVCAALGVNAATSCTTEILGTLFAHIFKCGDLNSIPEGMRHTMKSAIDKVRADFATEPVEQAVPAPVPAPAPAPAPVPAPAPAPVVQSMQESRQPLSRGRGNHHGGDGAVARPSTEHHASHVAKQQEIDQMMRMMQSDPEVLARFKVFLANQSSK